MRYDVNANPKWQLYRDTVVKGLNLSDFKSEQVCEAFFFSSHGANLTLNWQVWYESKDGTKVPMFIVRHKDTPIDGTAPVIQYGI